MAEINYNTDFKYIWFMTCLYHDFGYVYEKGNTINNNELNNIANCGIKELENILGIENDLYDSSYNDPKDNIYSKEQVEIYLKYRAETKSKDNKGKIDHGIVGGLMLFDRLIKNYNEANEAYNNVSKDNKDIDQDDFDYHGLHFSQNNNKLYAKVSDAIIAHNIWVKTYNEIPEVVEKKSEITTKLNKDHYLGFLLGIIDTLEPLKQYKKTSKNTNQLANDNSTTENSNQLKNNDKITENTNRLSKYHFKKIENGFELSIDNDNKKNNNGNIDNNNIIDKYKNITFELREWIDINAEFNDKKKTIKITLPPTEE